MTNNPLLSVKNLHVTVEQYQTHQTLLKGAQLTINAGETLGLLGESGCGKSLASLAIMRLLPNAASIEEPSEIFFNDKDLLALPEREMRAIRGRRIAMIFQEPMTALNPVMTVGEQITEVIHCHFSYSKKEVREKVLNALDAVGLKNIKQCYQQYPHQLSGGMKQRVMLAMAIAAEPELLIADEPTTALDVTLQSQILTLLSDLQSKTGMGMLFISHDVAVLKDIADSISVMYSGHVIEEASAKQFFQGPLHPYSQALLNALPSIKDRGKRLTNISGEVPKLNQATMKRCRFLTRCPYAKEVCKNTLPGWKISKHDHRVRCLLPIDFKERASQQQELVQKTCDISKKKAMETILSVENLKVSFRESNFFRPRSHYAVNGISFSVNAGETLALVGESGCGKSTTAKALLGLLPISHGDIYYAGSLLLKRKELCQEIQLIFQDPFSAMNPRMMIAEVLSEGLQAHGVSYTKKTLNVLLEQVGLPSTSLYRYPHEFSGGQRQRICIARALALSPKLLILDEPTSALDISIQAQVLNLLKQLQKDRGLAYLFITHDISVVAYMADKVAVMRDGEIVEQGDVRAILQSPQSQYTQTLISSVPHLVLDGLKTS